MPRDGAHPRFSFAIAVHQITISGILMKLLKDESNFEVNNLQQRIKLLMSSF